MVSRVGLAMFLDGDIKALRAYHAGDRESELVTLYFRRAALGFAAITKSAGYRPLLMVERSQSRRDNRCRAKYAAFTLWKSYSYRFLVLVRAIF